MRHINNTRLGVEMEGVLTAGCRQRLRSGWLVPCVMPDSCHENTPTSVGVGDGFVTLASSMYSSAEQEARPGVVIVCHDVTGETSCLLVELILQKYHYCIIVPRGDIFYAVCELKVMQYLMDFTQFLGCSVIDCLRGQTHHCFSLSVLVKLQITKLFSLYHKVINKSSAAVCYE